MTPQRPNTTLRLSANVADERMGKRKRKGNRWGETQVWEEMKEGGEIVGCDREGWKIRI